jgi:BMFP domain-containing protein YqiC
MMFPLAPDSGTIARHPSQLYEAALEGIVFFLVLRLFTHRFRRLPYPSFVSGVFCVGYAIARIFDEIARLMTDAASVAQGVRREAETVFRTQMERFVADMDLVKREEFDVVREMASKARAENEALAARVAELEAKLGIASPSPEVKAKRSPKKPAEG